MEGFNSKTSGLVERERQNLPAVAQPEDDTWDWRVSLATRTGRNGWSIMDPMLKYFSKLFGVVPIIFHKIVNNPQFHASLPGCATAGRFRRSSSTLPEVLELNLNIRHGSSNFKISNSKTVRANRTYTPLFSYVSKNDWALNVFENWKNFRRLATDYSTGIPVNMYLQEHTKNTTGIQN